MSSATSSSSQNAAAPPSSSIPLLGSPIHLPSELMNDSPPHLAYTNPSVYDTVQRRTSYYPANDQPCTSYQCHGAYHAYCRKIHYKVLDDEANRKEQDKKATRDLLRQKTKESKLRRKIWEETHPRLPPLTIKKPRVQQDLDFDPICHCPKACQSHPGDTPQNPIHIDLEDNQPRATSAQKARVQPVVPLRPVFLEETNEVVTNLEAIQIIRKWYEDLETQALLQLDLSPFDVLTTEDRTKEIKVKVKEPPV